MAIVTAQMVKELRSITGAGVLDCKEALQAHGGDYEAAAAALREKGLAAAAKRADRATREGLVGSYIHAGSRVGALVEVNCETDFVARTDEFKALAHDLAMQVVAGKPQYLTAEEIPAGVLERDMLERGLSGDADRKKYIEETCLMEQPFIKDTAITIRELVQQKNALLRENVVVRRFARLEVGG